MVYHPYVSNDHSHDYHWFIFVTLNGMLSEVEIDPGTLLTS